MNLEAEFTKNMVIGSLATAHLMGIPVVECDEIERGPGWACNSWIVAICPFCGERHSHGAGQGLRISHCTPKPSGSYYLVAKGSDHHG